MKKIIIFLIIFLAGISLYSQQQYFRYDIEKISEKVFTLDSSDATVADMDTIIYRTQPYYTQLADTVYFIVEISADSSSTGTAKDSIYVGIAAEWLSPSNYSNTLQSMDTTGFGSQSLLGTRAATVAGSFFYFYAGNGGYAKQHVKLRLWIWLQNMRPDAKQMVRVKVFMVKYWTP